MQTLSGIRKKRASEGLYYRIEVRPKERFLEYRTHDIGREGHTKRLAGQSINGTWRTKSWLIQKEDAHVEGKELIIDSAETRRVLHTVRGPIVHYKGDVYIAQPEDLE